MTATDLRSVATASVDSSVHWRGQRSLYVPQTSVPGSSAAVTSRHQAVQHKRLRQPHLLVSVLCSSCLASTIMMPLACLFSVLPLQLLEQRQADQLEAVLGWPMFSEGDDRLGWLMNFTTVSLQQLCSSWHAGLGLDCCDGMPYRLLHS